MSYYDTIHLEKGMYQTKEGFTAQLERLDPSAQYDRGPLKGLDAFQRQLKRFDIRVGGQNSDMVEKFFSTADSSVLFPEYVARAVRQGMENADLLPDIIATTTRIEGMDYRTITSLPEEEDKQLKPVAEGAVLPQTVVKTQDNLVHLHKRGRMLVSSYEALRFQRLDLFTVTLRQIGAYIARAQLKDAIDVLLNGDGNSNAAAQVSAAGTSLAYADIVKLWAQLAPYELNTLLAGTNMVQQILDMTEMKDAQAGLNFQATGKLVTPVGASLLHAPGMADKTIIGLDKTCALEKVQAGDVLVDYDKLIDRQLERAAVSCIAGFAKIFVDAAKKLTVS